MDQQHCWERYFFLSRVFLLDISTGVLATTRTRSLSRHSRWNRDHFSAGSHFAESRAANHSTSSTNRAQTRSSSIQVMFTIVESLEFGQMVMATSLYLCIYASLIKRLCVSILWESFFQKFTSIHVSAALLALVTNLLPSPSGRILGSLHHNKYEVDSENVETSHGGSVVDPHLVFHSDPGPSFFYLNADPVTG